MSSNRVVAQAPGRPFDPSVEWRAAQAVIEVYGDFGWAGFTVDKVAARSKVGKAAIYRRWPTRQDLLASAIAQVDPEARRIEDTGHIRTDLELMAVGIIERLRTPLGLAELRLQLEAKIYPEVLDASLDPIRAAWVEIARTCMSRAVSRGQLVEGAPVGLIFDLIRGAILNRFLFTPSPVGELLPTGSREFARRIVAQALSGFETLK